MEAACRGRHLASKRNRGEACFELNPKQRIAILVMNDDGYLILWRDIEWKT
jgi:hypothetical protein